MSTLNAFVGTCKTWRQSKTLSIGMAILTTLLASGFSYELSMVFITPSPDFRYSPYMIMVTLLSASTFLSILEQRHAVVLRRAGSMLRKYARYADNR